MRTIQNKKNRELAKLFAEQIENGGEFILKVKRQYVYCCKNNGAFQESNSGLPGYATFLWRKGIEEFLDWTGMLAGAGEVIV